MAKANKKATAATWKKNIEHTQHVSFRTEACVVGKPTVYVVSLDFKLEVGRMLHPKLGRLTKDIVIQAVARGETKLVAGTVLDKNLKLGSHIVGDVQEFPGDTALEPVYVFIFQSSGL